MSRAAEGCTSEIPKALWDRYKTYGVPNQWFVAWFAATLIVVSMTYHPWGWKGVVGALGCCGTWLVYLQHKTRQDQQWDEMLANDLGQRYQPYYDTE